MTDHRYTPPVPAPTADNVYRVVNYGLVDVTGVADSSAAVLAAFAACYAGGGGTVELPATPAGGKGRMDSQLVIPNDGGAIPKQPPMRLRGAGPLVDGEWQTNGQVTGGTLLDLRSATGPAKIDTRGSGVLILDSLTLTQTLGAGDTNPFLQTTNTTVVLVPGTVSVWGHASLSGAACIQDAFILGGTSAVIGNGANAAFQGYGTMITGAYFARIRRGAYGRAFCNAARITDNTFSATCGSDNTAAAIQVDGSNADAAADSNVIKDNLIECTGYVYAIRLTRSRRNLATGNSGWDQGGDFLAYYFLEGADCNDNVLHLVLGSLSLATWYTDSSASNSMFVAGSMMLRYQLGQSGTLVQPAAALGTEAATIFWVKRSTLEATHPNAIVASLLNRGTLTLGDTSWSTLASLVVKNTAGQTTYDHTSIVKAAGPLDIYAGAGATDAVRIARNGGLLQLGTAATSVTISSGTGAPAIAGKLGDRYFRSDTPTVVLQRDYICTVAGAAGVATWVGYA